MQGIIFAIRVQLTYNYAGTEAQLLLAYNNAYYILKAA